MHVHFVVKQLYRILASILVSDEYEKIQSAVLQNVSVHALIYVQVKVGQRKGEVNDGLFQLKKKS
jgi:hypothetical protein